MLNYAAVVKLTFNHDMDVTPKYTITYNEPETNQNQHCRHSNKCEVCDKELSAFSNLKKHMAIHLSDKIFNCNECGSAFPTPYHLNRHITHKNFSENLYTCCQCDKQFVTKNGLKKHMLIHMNEHPCICKVCGNTFKRKDNMNRHMKIHAK